jgi:tRNA dimethylallyltransferase
VGEPIPLVCICGETASGKTSLAVALAQRLQGQGKSVGILSSDALAVYRGLDIGTAKPTIEERGGIEHDGIDICEPEDSCPVSVWLAHAEERIRHRHQAGGLTIVVGGSPLYLKALLEGLSAGPPKDDQLREKLTERYNKDPDLFFSELTKYDPEYAQHRHVNDAKRLRRAMEVFQLTGKPFSSFHTTDGIRRPDWRTCLIGLRWDKEILHNRINARVKAMFAHGLLEEVQSLQPRLGHEARQGVGYKEILSYFAGEYNLEHAQYQVARNTRRLAKHQRTWYRRFVDMHWLAGDRSDLAEAAFAIAEENCWK